MKTLDDTKMVNDLPPELQERIKKLRDNFLIALVKRAGGSVEFSVKEIDEASDLLTISIEEGKFILSVTARN